MDNNRPDILISTINDFKKSSISQNISIHGKAYSLVATRVAIARRNLGSSLDIKKSREFGYRKSLWDDKTPS